ncbi:MAG TPA: carboxylesterase family protein, partial [Kofleriaceae bacterium]|nr:carboxylesterase family protein [Kofleriaceae bacterium]
MKVSTSSGIVTGMIKRGVAMWRGIPYATAPRFRAPGPAPSWSGERDCVKFGPVAVQSRDPRVAVMSGVGEQIAMSEEALVLNVVAPIPDGRARPVVVWIHGGAFVMGSGSTPIYDGTSFAANHGVVVVTINYRLGLLGFLAVHETNVALLDQIAALRWVKDNIAGFGGDPDRVTVMGESAGAVSIANLLAMPAARGLFQRAILESGGARLSPLTRDDTDAMTREATEALGDPDAASIDAILKLQDRIAAKGGLAAFAPSVDGVHIPISPSAAIA